MAYYSAARPVGGILPVAIRGISAKFYVRDLEELRGVESDAVKERHILEQVISTLRPGDTVYDVGANVGLYAIPLAKVIGETGRVIAFEPTGENYRRLQENLKLNATTNVCSFQKALGDWTGEGKISMGPATRPGPGLVRSDLAVAGNYRLVDVVEGDTFREAANLPLPRAIKIDVEGSEHAVLCGMRQTLAHPDCILVMCEIHPQFLPAEAAPQVVLALLKSLGFASIELYPCAGRAEYHAVCSKPDAPVQ
jgi:FkbM family methyltransferase